MTRSQTRKHRFPNLGLETDSGYAIGPCVFCRECATEVTDERGRVCVWYNPVLDEYQDSAEDLPDWRREGVPANAILYPEYAEVAPFGNDGETDSPSHCESCAILIREGLTSDGQEYVREYCRKSRSKTARLYRQTFNYLFD